MTRKLQSRRSPYSVSVVCKLVSPWVMVYLYLKNFYSHEVTPSQKSTGETELLISVVCKFDPDSAEFVSDISDYATEYRKEEVAEIPLDFLKSWDNLLFSKKIEYGVGVQTSYT